MATLNLAGHMREITLTDLQVRQGLAGRAGAAEIGTLRRGAELMREHVTRSPVQAAFFPGGSDGWRVHWLREAERELCPSNTDDPAVRKAYEAKQEEYVRFCRRLEADPLWRTHVVIDKFNGKSYLIEDNREIQGIMGEVAAEFLRWFRGHPLDRLFLQLSAQASFLDFLVERPDVLADIRMAQRLPADRNPAMDIPIERPLIVHAVEMAIGLIPVVGNIATSYEVYTGRDLFGYALTDAERGVMAASVLLPTAGRLVRAGRAMYTEARLVQLYGREVQGWRLAIAADARVAAEPEAAQVIRRAEKELRLHRKWEAELAREVAKALPKLVRGVLVAVIEHEPRIIELLARLRKQFPVLHAIDAPSLLRILEKGPNPGHLKGQLLEELIESRVLPWLRDPAGAYALGIKGTGRKKIEYIPGHMIRGEDGRQFTDGMLAYRDKGELVPVAVFEVKAGDDVVRDLHLGEGGVSSLTAEERLSFIALVKERLKIRQAIAQARGKPFTQTFEDVAKEYVHAERGGQIRRDIERLSRNDVPGRPGLTHLFIGTEQVPIRFTLSQVKFFGVVPRGAPTRATVRELEREGVAFEAIAADLTSAELDRVAEQLAPLATEFAQQRLR
ncbi:pre-toxin TG domain-containing protein [Streptomyces sp. NPDC059989]|uniref:pre-toxin TG domain-containing protein n=1 Tax=Streptomyces sp. NPDC059989 TaxID=3347026 RepID=UPI0036898772